MLPYFAEIYTEQKTHIHTKTQKATRAAASSWGTIVCTRLRFLAEPAYAEQ
jgi:hypothetical protein